MRWLLMIVVGHPRAFPGTLARGANNIKSVARRRRCDLETVKGVAGILGIESHREQIPWVEARLWNQLGRSELSAAHECFAASLLVQKRKIDRENTRCHPFV